VSANIAVIYAGAGLREVAEAFCAAAGNVSAATRLRHVPDAGGEDDRDAEATLEDLIWADGVAFATAAAAGRPSPALLAFIDHAVSHWTGADLFDKVVSIFTDEPEHFAADDVVRPIYNALYQWGAVIVGPRATELALKARPQRADTELDASSLSGPRQRSANYRARRLTTLAGVLANERTRRSWLEL
jgi:multimeric flavodoxin WrbA